MSTELAPRIDPALVKDAPVPAFGAAEMRRALTAYKQLQQALDESLPDCLMQLDGRAFRKKNYWRAVATAFNLTVDCLEEVREIYGLLENGGENYGYRVTYRAATPAGRATVGDGICTAQEKSRGRMKATEHNCRSHAHTRAFNRAVSNLVAFGEVSFEEIDDDHSREEAYRPPVEHESLRQARRATSKHAKPKEAPPTFDWLARIYAALTKPDLLTINRELKQHADELTAEALEELRIVYANRLKELEGATPPQAPPAEGEIPF